MIDLQIAQIARLEHEEMVHSLVQPDDWDVSRTHAPRGWESWQTVGFASSLAKTLAALANKLKGNPEPATDRLLTVQGLNSLPG